MADELTANLTSDQVAGILAFAPAPAATTEVLFERSKPAPVLSAAEVQWAYDADQAALDNHRRGGRRPRRNRAVHP